MTTFYYFGYGSNINLLSLRAKGVEPIGSQKAILKGWRLRFNVEHWFPHEGGMGNIEPGDSSDYVEGVLHLCLKKHLPAMDAVEAYGIGYDRIEVEVQTSTEKINALTYVGMSGALREDCMPTMRYLSIITKGAEVAGLSAAYLAKLRSTPILRSEDFIPFAAPEGDWPEFDLTSLTEFPQYTGLAGQVFDMSEARPKLDPLRDLWGGKDMTLFHVKRHDSSSGEETLFDYLEGKITPAAQAYVNRYLVAYEQEFSYVGTISYV